VLHGYGEPLLSPHFGWMVQTAKSYGSWIDFDTNGLALTPRRSRELIDAGLDCFTVSIDAATSDTYSWIRGGDFDKLVSNLEALNELKRERNTVYPRIKFKYVVMDRNLEEVPSLIDLAARLEVSQVILQNLIVWPGQEKIQNQSVFRQVSRVDAIYNESKRKAEDLGIILDYWGDGVQEKEDGEASCPFRHFTVMCDGSVGPCGAQKFVWGNVREKPVREIWNGPEYREMRRQFVTKEYNSICAECPTLCNTAEVHEKPDVSYVPETLKARRWGNCRH
jgi:radical SAM protein with 4Fe4S-binding SPASM domain